MDLTELRRTISLCKEGINSADQNLIKLTGRNFDKNNDSSLGASGPRFLNTNKRRLNVDPEMTDQQNESVKKARNENKDGGGPALNSVVQMTKGRTRDDALSELKRKENPKEKERCKRLFSHMMGTLSSIVRDAEKSSSDPQNITRLKIEKKVEEGNKLINETIQKEQSELLRSKRERQNDLKILNQRYRAAEAFDRWRAEKEKMKGFIRTTRTPFVFYRPRAINDEAQLRIDQTGREIDALIETRRKKLELEISKAVKHSESHLNSCNQGTVAMEIRLNHGSTAVKGAGATGTITTGTCIDVDVESFSHDHNDGVVEGNDNARHGRRRRHQGDIGGNGGFVEDEQNCPVAPLGGAGERGVRERDEGSEEDYDDDMIDDAEDDEEEMGMEIEISMHEEDHGRVGGERGDCGQGDDGENRERTDEKNNEDKERKGNDSLQSTAVVRDDQVKTEKEPCDSHDDAIISCSISPPSSPSAAPDLSLSQSSSYMPSLESHRTQSVSMDTVGNDNNENCSATNAITLCSSSCPAASTSSFSTAAVSSAHPASPHCPDSNLSEVQMSNDNC